MKRWIVLACVAALVFAAFAIVVNTGWSSADRGDASAERLDEELRWPEANGVTPTPIPPTPTSVPTPPPG